MNRSIIPFSEKSIDSELPKADGKTSATYPGLLVDVKEKNNCSGDMSGYTFDSYRDESMYYDKDDSTMNQLKKVFRSFMFDNSRKSYYNSFYGNSFSNKDTYQQSNVLEDEGDYFSAKSIKPKRTSFFGGNSKYNTLSDTQVVDMDTASRKTEKPMNPCFRCLYHMFTPSPSHILHIIWIWFLLPIILISSVTALVLYQQYNLPTVKTSATPLQEFSEERAKLLYDSIGYLNKTRVVGSENHDQMRANLIQYLQTLQSNLPEFLNMEIQQQSFGFFNFSVPLQNVIVRVSSKLNSTVEDASLLLSAHYDSVFPSHGGVDDGSGIVVLLEILNTILHQSTAPKFPILFNFNTAEEVNLNGARAFTQEKSNPIVSVWASTVKRFLNSDSNGANSKSIMYRASPSSLSAEIGYAKAPHIHSNVLGEEVMKWIPNDTDFSSYVRDGNLTGLDFAFYQNGYSYHTNLDTKERLSEGSLQHLGDNLLAMVQYYCYHSDSTMHSTLSQEDYIYFDYIGIFFISIPETYALVFQYGLIGCCVLLPLLRLVLEMATELVFKALKKKSIAKTLQRSVFGFFVSYFFALSYVVSVILAIGVSLVTGVIFQLLHPMVYYSHPYTVVVPVYMMSSLLGVILGQAICTHITNCCSCRFVYKTLQKKTSVKSDLRLYDKLNKHMYSFSKEQFTGLGIFWGIILLAISVVKLRSLYIVPIYCFCCLVVLIVLLSVERVSLICAYLCCFHWKVETKTLVDELENETIHQELKEEEEEDAKKKDGELHFDASLEEFGLLKPITSKKQEIELRQKNIIVRAFVNIVLKQRLYWNVAPLFMAFFGALPNLDILLRILGLMVPNFGYRDTSSSLFGVDLIIAALSSVFCTLLVINYAPLLSRASNYCKLIIVFLFAWLVSIACIILLVPTYGELTPKRMYLSQSRQMTFDFDATLQQQQVIHNETILMMKNSDSISMAPYLTQEMRNVHNVTAMPNHFFKISLNPEEFDQLWTNPNYVPPTYTTVQVVKNELNVTISLQIDYPKTRNVRVQLLNTDHLRPLSASFVGDAQEEFIVNSLDIVPPTVSKLNIPSTSMVMQLVYSTADIVTAKTVSLSTSIYFCDDFAQESSTFVTNFFTKYPATTMDGRRMCDYLTSTSTLNINNIA